MRSISGFLQQHLPNYRPTVTTYSSSSVGGAVPNTLSDQKLSGRKRSYNNSNSTQLDMDHENDQNEKKKKRMEHREAERKRRQDMANLCSSLRSLLPLHFIKGKRSMSEHMNQAVSYIQHLQQNIKRLNTKRDELKKTCCVTDSSLILKKNIKRERLMADCSQNPMITVTVSCSFNGGIDVLIKSCTKFPISRVMEALVQEGLDVISCNSTKVNERIIHSIQSQVIDVTTCIQVSMLQQKLAELVNTTL